MIYNPDINGKQDTVYLLCSTKEAGSSVWRITWTDFCIRVCDCIPGLGKTTVKPCKWPPLILSRKVTVLLGPEVNKRPYWFMWECKKMGVIKASPYTECYSLSSLFLTNIEGIHKHQSIANGAITWVHTGHHQGWSTTGEASRKGCTDGPERPNTLRLGPWARANCFHCRRIGYITKDCTDKRRGYICCFHCGRIGHMASSCPGNEPGNKMSVAFCSLEKMWTRHNQSSE